jgi:hypothetical protein
VECLSCYPGSISSSVADLDASQMKASHSSQGSEGIETSNRSSFESADGNDTAPTSVGTSPELRSADAANLGFHASRMIKPLPPIESSPPKRFPPFDSGPRCESCTIYVPDETWQKLPAGAPGSPNANDIGRNGSAVLRSRESLQVYGQQYDSDIDEEPAVHQLSLPESFDSNTSASSLHKHTLTYISTSSPTDPSTYAVVRNAFLRTLSGEVLPRGTTAGGLSFGDPINGYTIAYKFQLPDQHARGGHRDYALLAVASNERRACQATALIWTHFQRIASDIMTRRERTIQKSKPAEDSGDENSQPGLLSVSSFLTGRMTDPDGFLRYNGGGGPKAHRLNLTEMVDDDKFFAELHVQFITLLRDLRWRFGS